MIITPKTLIAIQEYAAEQYPKEMCGLIVGGKFIKCVNESDKPEEMFRINKAVYFKALQSGKLQAVIHSHCFDPNTPFKYDPRWPSTLDMKTWMAMNIPWGIVASNGNETSSVLWMDDNEIAPLVGREFIHGVQDCYAIVRDYYRTVLNINLINGARGMEWWDKGEDLYSDNFEKAGFVEIAKEEADVNDVCLFQVKSPVINHAAVITGSNQILHHLFHRLSGHDRLDRWDKVIVKYIRYVGVSDVGTD